MSTSFTLEVKKWIPSMIFFEKEMGALKYSALWGIHVIYNL